MKTTKFFLLSLTFSLLLTASFALAHGEDTTDQSRSDNMMNANHDSFNGNSEYMNITGELTVTNYITVSLSVIPNDEMQEMMNENMDDEEITQLNEYMNRMDVKIFKLVEFYDTNDNGYSSDDIEVSEFLLNNETLKQPALINSDDKVSYEVQSNNSDVFSMTLDVFTENQMPFAVKWSYDINFPFTQPNTTLAIVHEIFSMNRTMGQDMMEDNIMDDEMADTDMINHQNDTSDDHSQGMMMDDHDDLPMMFSWDETAKVDGIEKNVTATDINNGFVLSIPQGNNIFYDPQISIDQDALTQVDINVSDIISVDFDITTYILPVIALLLGSLLIITLKRKQ